MKCSTLTALALALMLVFCESAEAQNKSAGPLEGIESMIAEGRLDEAITEMRAGLASGSLSQADVGRYLCEALEATGDIEAARAAAEAALAATQEDPITYLCASRVRALQGDGPAAVTLAQEFTKAYKASGKSGKQADRMLAHGKECEFWGHMLSHELEAALVDANEIEEHYPRAPEWRWLRTVALSALGKYEDAVAMWDGVEYGGISRADVVLFGQLDHIARMIERSCKVSMPPPVQLVRAILRDHEFFMCVSLVEKAKGSPDRRAKLIPFDEEEDYGGGVLAVLPRSACAKKKKAASESKQGQQQEATVEQPETLEQQPESQDQGQQQEAHVRQPEIQEQNQEQQTQQQPESQDQQGHQEARVEQPENQKQQTPESQEEQVKQQAVRVEL